MTTLIRSVLLLCLVWLGGCTYVGIATPITDPSVPADQKLIGSWVTIQEGIRVNIIEDKESNKLDLVMVGPESNTNSCVVFETRTLQLTDYGLFEVSIQDGAYECVSPHKNVLNIDWDKYKKAGLGQFYALIPYKLAKLNDPECPSSGFLEPKAA